MFDLSDLLSKPVGLILSILRALWWLGWDFAVQTVGWSIGWIILRTLTVGRFPFERFGGVDEASGVHAFIVEFIGLGSLAAGIWWLAGQWPNL